MAKTEREWGTPPPISTKDYVSTLVYTDQSLFDEELEKVKKSTWKFVCHESEIPERNDYRCVNHAGVPLIVTRSDDGEIRTFINACSHRSALVLRQPSGNAKQWICLFHRWAFNSKGDCIAIPREGAYEESGICKENRGLREVRTGVRLGMVFVNLSDDAPSLDDYVGDALENVADVMGTVELEVFHYHQTVLNVNWKQWHETNMETYHEYLHFVNRNVAMKSKGYGERTWRLYPNGHGTLNPMQQTYSNIKGWKQRNDQPLPGMQPNEFRTVKIFPDTNILARATVIRIDTSTPISPNQTLVEWRGIGIKGESEQDRIMRRNHHNQVWGPLGRNLYEDAYAVECVEEANRSGEAPYGVIARHEDMKTQDDVLMRTFYAEWSKRMGRAAHDPFNSKPDDAN